MQVASQGWFLYKPSLTLNKQHFKKVGRRKGSKNKAMARYYQMYTLGQSFNYKNLRAFLE